MMETKIVHATKADAPYIAEVAVSPEYRGRGVASALINAMYERARLSGKPLGLLCEKSNVRARKLYDSLGFRQVGETPFANEMMDHLQKL